MTRRLFGAVSGPIAFFLVATLVFAGLGWVTYSALGVERSQRESAARAELGNNLRVALWQLDSRMLPTLGVEDSRPYYHYAPPDPAATPLFVATLPDWMKLHFQLEPTTGWTSPLVPDPATCDLVREAWAEVSPHNMSPERAQVLKDLIFRCPAGPTYDLFAATDRSIPADSYSLAAPLVAGDVQAETEFSPVVPFPGASSVNPAPSAPPNADGAGIANVSGTRPSTDVVRILGIELCFDPNGKADSVRLEAQKSQQKYVNPSQAVDNMRGMQQGLGGGQRGGGRLSQGKAIDNEKQVADWMNRAGTLDRAIRDAKNAAEYQMPKGQLLNSYGQNYLPSIDPRNNSNTLNSTVGNKLGAPPTLPTTPSTVPPGSTPVVTAKLVGPPPGPGTPARDDRYNPSKESKDASPTTGRGFTREQRDGSLSLTPVEAACFAYRLSTSVTQPGEARLRAVLDELEKSTRKDEAERFRGVDKNDANKNRDPAPPLAPTTVPLAEDRAARPVAPAIPAADAGVPHAIHLGSMRPQWVTAPDGSEMLVLVRAAKVDDKVVYQGVIVDWPTLSAALTEEIRPLFPQARLVPIKDSSAVYPDRAMTALPVQLDPGPDPALPPAGWTPLRIGLVLAWLAAIIAFAAVGFAGWGLIDLAERRIRFVSAVTHELRTPLTSLRLYLDLLVSGMIQDEQKRQEYLATLAMESDRLHRLIDNVLDYAKLEKRKKNGDIKPVKVAELLDQLRQTWTDRVAHDGKELSVISTLPADRAVNTDAAMIQQIVGNLIDNARKYSRDAADKRIWVWAKPGTGNGVVLEVEDRGAGVPPAERKSIFKPFRRGEKADCTAGGAGLGLALAKSWAEVLGGTLSYRPADGGTGACFRLELPGK
jgi:signal transduction histidine kinase